MVRIASSLRQRTAPAHVVVQRLAGSSPSDRLARALTALGRVVKTIYILRYLHEEDLRRRVQLQLNRGESRHDLARWLFFANQGEFRTGDYEEIMNKASCLSLLSNAVLVWNTVRMGEIVARTCERGANWSRTRTSARISPLAYAHVIPNGTYVFDRSPRMVNICARHATVGFRTDGAGTPVRLVAPVEEVADGVGVVFDSVGVGELALEELVPGKLGPAARARDDCRWWPDVVVGPTPPCGCPLSPRVQNYLSRITHRGSVPCSGL